MLAPQKQFLMRLLAQLRVHSWRSRVSGEEKIMIRVKLISSINVIAYGLNDRVLTPAG
jgi:hypothetical protein